MKRFHFLTATAAAMLLSAGAFAATPVSPKPSVGELVATTEAAPQANAATAKTCHNKAGVEVPCRMKKHKK